MQNPFSAFVDDSTEGGDDSVVDGAENVERRREELEALEAIYGEEKVWVEGDGGDALGVVCVTLEPAAWAAAAAPPRVTVACRRPRGYPESRPLAFDVRVAAADRAAVPTKTLTGLRARLDGVARSLVGDVAIHALCAEAVEALDALEETARPLDEQMALREARERETAAARDGAARRAAEDARRARDAEHRARVASNLEDERGALQRRAQPLRLDSLEGDFARGSLSSDESEGPLGRGDDRESSRFHADFKEVGVLGRGGCGEVCRCLNRLDRRTYAIKKVRLRRGATRRDAKRQLREVEALAAVSHPHVVRYYQAWIEGLEAPREPEMAFEDFDLCQNFSEDDGSDSSSDDDDALGSSTRASAVDRKFGGCLYIQMEYCATTLRQAIDSGRLAGCREDAWRLLRQIIEALAYLHGLKLVHRDLKPANVLLDAAQNVARGVPRPRRHSRDSDREKSVTGAPGRSSSATWASRRPSRTTTTARPRATSRRAARVLRTFRSAGRGCQIAKAEPRQHHHRGPASPKQPPRRPMTLEK